MAPAKNVRAISQEAFEGLVRENMDDLGMDPEEALQDAIETLTLQGVDLSGIVKCIPGVSSLKDDPVIQSLDKVKEITSKLRDQDYEPSTTGFNGEDLDEIAKYFDKLSDLCSSPGSGNASIAARNGGVELVCSICSKIRAGCERPLVSALTAMASFLYGVQTTETFRKIGGPKIMVDIITDNHQNVIILNSSFSVVAAAATGNELLKEAFMELKIDELLIQIMRAQSRGSIGSLYDAVRVLLTPDDNRVLASQVYGYARRFADIGIAVTLVDALREGLSSPSLVSASIALKAVAVNDEICRLIADNGGIDAVLCCIDDSGEQNNKVVAKAFCSLLSKLAGSDANKTAIVQNRGMDTLMKLASSFSDDPSVLQEIMPVICVLSLRSPGNAASAIEAGAGDFVIQAMEKFPAAHQMQRQACFMIRNLVVRNPENRIILLNNGIERLIRRAKESHESCKDAATDALRDLGLDNYNS
ncbi:armadillo repeat-containing protein 6 [Macadamia integrifolia]|uniref:armadillo repeat-containing protein 6 n=1 Tax=Macadamia integrifolia TaxID=60698 RepID=UPI001C4F235B|nr:armadillo repeat-containing protein 6 [Macadamia integrifolia]